LDPTIYEIWHAVGCLEGRLEVLQWLVYAVLGAVITSTVTLYIAMLNTRKRVVNAVNGKNEKHKEE